METMAGIVTLIMLVGIIALIIAAFVALTEWGGSKDYCHSKELKEFVSNLLEMTKSGEISWERDSYGFFTSHSGNANIDVSEGSSRINVNNKKLLSAGWPWDRSIRKLKSEIIKVINEKDKDLVRHIISGGAK
jgi:hypothetical protein